MHYFWATVWHKWFVLLASFKVGLPLWRALVHDLSKFTRAELPHYNRQICGDKDDPRGFAMALLHHWNNNPHHYQYWIDRPDHSGHYRKIFEQSGIVKNGCFEMPSSSVREMIADWLGKGKSLTGSWDMTEWIFTNLPKMRLHPDTRKAIMEILYYSLGYDVYRLGQVHNEVRQDES